LFSQQLISESLLNLYRSAQELPVSVFPEAGISIIKKFVEFDMAMYGIISIDEKSSLINHYVHLHNEQMRDSEEWLEIRNIDFVFKNMVKHHGKSISYISHIALSGPDYGPLLDYTIRKKHSNLLTLANTYNDKGLHSAISLRRADKRWQFGTNDNRVLEVLMPHFNEALRINQALFTQRIQAATSESFRGCFIFDDGGLIHYQDPTFESLSRLTFKSHNLYKLPRELEDIFCKNRHHRAIKDKFIFEVQKIGSLNFGSIRAKASMDLLTERELEIAMFYGTGLSSKDIATELFISPSTVRRHLEAIYLKLNISSKTDLAYMTNTYKPKVPIQALQHIFNRK
jgi:DNA-binding CsgD family transcriptional regulator